MRTGIHKSAIALLFALFCFSLPCLAQNLTGIWRGYFHTYTGEEYKFEIQIEQTRSNRISGVSYSYLDTRFYGKASLTGSFNKAGRSALIQEIKTVEVKMAGGSFACIMKCSFVYSRSGKEEFLEGVYSSMFETSDSARGIMRGDNCGGGTVVLRKVTTSDFYVEPFLRDKQPPSKPAIKPRVKTEPVPPVKKPATNQQTKPKPKPPVSTPPEKDTATKAQVIAAEPRQAPKVSTPPVTRSRENELVQTFTVTEEEVTVRFYDNGDVDNDTISVYLDGKPIVTMQRLSANPITVKVKLSPDNPEHTLVMVAENLGRIPPNTSLMIVHDGENRYQASITSTEQKNAMVRFRYQKKGQ